VRECRLDGPSRPAFTIALLTQVYRVEYAPPGQRSVVKTYQSETRLERGQWIAVEGTYLVVERVSAGKHGDAYVGIAYCRMATG
jgi:hypothetical protein